MCDDWSSAVHDDDGYCHCVGVLHDIWERGEDRPDSRCGLDIILRYDCQGDSNPKSVEENVVSAKPSRVFCSERDGLGLPVDLDNSSMA